MQTSATTSADAGRADSLPGSQTSLIVLIGALYFAQGVPLGFIFQAFPAMLRSQDAPLELIAWVPALGLPWAFKFLWAPWIDTRWLPALGRRRTWLISMQILMMLAMGTVALAPLGGATMGAAMAALLAASFVSATQDIATDGLAAERLTGKALIGANALSVGGMMAGVLTGGAGTLLVVEHLGFTPTIAGLVAILALCAIPVLIWREDAPGKEVTSAGASLLRSVKRPHFLPIFAVAGLYAAAHITETSLAKLFLVDQGWSLGEVGLVATIGSLAMIAIGCGAGSWALLRGNIWRCIQTGLAVGTLALLIWIGFVLGYATPSLLTAGIAAALGGAGLGLAAVAVFTIAMRFSARGNQTGTDVTLFKSINVIGEIGAASAATMVAAKAGYGAGFAFGIALAVLAIALASLARRQTRTLDLTS
ncbi:MFS transporter [Methyloligella sp. 2.7D]|uniref:MFS transporter n=1 Tax=unclassified Methyloligella TaxID=2625955 RepID=UPI00157C12FA|nr:MFS transporter [Methyloligella sp. GL2]QKP76966.1 MFS transporter [Methyloligella sp. GL2]